MAIDPAKPFDLYFTVDPSLDGLRLDLFIKQKMPAMSRTKIQKHIKKGNVQINSEVITSSNRIVQLRDTILLCCTVPEEGVDIGKTIPLDIIYEDNDLLILNKQPGLVVHPTGRYRHNTLLNAIYWQYLDKLPADSEISLGNRLDQYTSGVIVVTKNKTSKRILQQDFEDRLPQKYYLALCSGIVKNDAGKIDLPIGPIDTDSNNYRMKIRHDSLGKPSLTYYKVLSRYRSGFTLVELNPITGRQHQLRLHMSTIGHPLLADARYGGEEEVVLTNKQGNTAKISRYALHAISLSFTHPITKEHLQVTAPLAKDMCDFLSLLTEEKI